MNFATKPERIHNERQAAGWLCKSRDRLGEVEIVSQIIGAGNRLHNTFYLKKCFEVVLESCRHF